MIRNRDHICKLRLPLQYGISGRDLQIHLDFTECIEECSVIRATLYQKECRPDESRIQVSSSCNESVVCDSNHYTTLHTIYILLLYTYIHTCIKIISTLPLYYLILIIYTVLNTIVNLTGENNKQNHPHCDRGGVPGPVYVRPFRHSLQLPHSTLPGE